VFNPGVVRFKGQYVMVFRNDYSLAGPSTGVFGEQLLDGTNLGLAFSSDGIRWEVQPMPCFEWREGAVLRAYDPRLTVLEGRCYLCFAVDTLHGIRGGIAVTDDFEHFEVLSLSVPDNRNLALFPERIGGRYIRLERPFPVYGRLGKERFDIWISESPDLIHWGRARLLLGVEGVPFANLKIGPGAPPVKTSRGWLTAFHAVDYDPARGKNGWEAVWQKRYTAGIMLLKLADPGSVLGLCPDPLLAPEVSYETGGGFRNNVIFPCGLIIEDSSEVKIYYGASDTTVCLATAQVDDLLTLCLPT
jgi:beta-1,4-mannooligosaccharide/beta-1,4-mannosyl-N-acetylglucosamine phosphorylase